MAQTFILIAQEPLDFKGHHYEVGDRLIADAFEAAPLQRRRATIEAPSEEQRAHGAHTSAQPLPSTGIRTFGQLRRGRQRKLVVDDRTIEVDDPRTKTPEAGE